MINGTLPHRGVDDWGSGAWNAPRGSRLHMGVDYACYPGTQIHCVYGGEVIKLGYPYGDDLSYRYVRIKDDKGALQSYFYVHPTVPLGAVVTAGSMIGFSQNLERRYKNIKNHVHYSVSVDGVYVDPEQYRW